MPGTITPFNSRMLALEVSPETVGSYQCMPHDPAASNWSRRLQPEWEGQDLATHAHSQSSPGDGEVVPELIPQLHSIKLVTLKGGESWRFSAAGAGQFGFGECGASEREGMTYLQLCRVPIFDLSARRVIRLRDIYPFDYKVSPISILAQIETEY